MPKVQQSSIDRLPDDIREKLQALLRDSRVTQLEATARINAILDEVDHPEKLSKSSVNRYAQKMEKVGARLRQSREVAQMWIAKLGAAPQGQTGHLVNEILRTLSFDVSLILQEGKLNAKTAPAVVDMLKGLALTMQRLEKAASENVKREAEIRRQAIEDAADAVGEAAKQSGVSDETIKIIRRDVLRMAN